MYYDSKPCEVCGAPVELSAKEPEDVPVESGPVGPTEGYVGGGDPTVDVRTCTNMDCPTRRESGPDAPTP